MGECNPVNQNPRYALYPLPVGCSGHRLCRRVLGMLTDDYLEVFDRVNLCDGAWDFLLAKHRTRKLQDASGRPAILLGSKVCRAWGVPYTPFTVVDDVLVLPHPSGLCRTWNEAGAYHRARTAVVKFLPVLRELVGKLNSNNRRH